MQSVRKQGKEVADAAFALQYINREGEVELTFVLKDGRVQVPQALPVWFGRDEAAIDVMTIMVAHGEPTDLDTGVVRQNFRHVDDVQFFHATAYEVAEDIQDGDYEILRDMLSDIKHTLEQ